MGEMLKRLATEEDGMGTVEIVLIIAVLIGLALLFKDFILEFMKSIIENIKGTESNFNPTDMTK